MFKILLPLFVGTLIVSCAADEKPIEPKKEKVVEAKPKKVYDPSSVVSRTEQFFDWYLENSRTLYKKRSSCIGAENGYHALNKKKLSEYTAWLQETNFFSEAFIAAEYKRWTTECANEMRENARRKKRIVGAPPCLFEGDVFFLIPERPTQKMVEALEFKVKEQTDSTALVTYDAKSALTWSKKDGSWKIDVWPN